MLFDPLSAGLGAATGELVFSEIMLGQFGGLGELEKFITVTIGVYIAGRLVKNPRNRAVVAGLPESVFFTEGFACLNDVLFSGILFCMLPTMFLVPKLYGKIEPLLGMKPRDEKTVLGSGGVSAKTVVICIIGFIAAVAAELLATGGFELIDWEASWAESTQAMIVAIIAAAVVALIVIGVIRSRAKVDKAA